MRCWLLLSLLPLAACARHGDENLGLSVKPTQVTIDLSRITQVSELERALMLPAAELDRYLGPHHLIAQVETTLQPAGQPVEQLDETILVDSDGAGHFHLVHDNSHERGMEAVLVGGDLYVRPRYGKFIRRPPEPGEPQRLRAIGSSAVAAYVRALSRWIVVHPSGRTEYAGHPALRLGLTAASAPRPGAAIREPAERWIDTVQAKQIEGEILLDAKSGAPLSARLAASYTFRRAPGERIETTVHARQTIAALPAGAIVAPADFVGSPTRPRPMLDRQLLLDGLGGNSHER